MTSESRAPKRPYEKKARAAQEEATRHRIIEAAIALHGTVGPARTTISSIADRAGVRRATVYRHFPDERALFRSCSGTWQERNPVPDPATWAGIDDPGARLDVALDALYRWYERAEPMLSAVLRDVDAGLAMGWGVRGKAARRLRATIGLALDFFAWRTLNERGLARGEATDIMASAVRAAAASAP
jgi:AcrR family transcriptional regulator